MQSTIIITYVQHPPHLVSLYIYPPRNAQCSSSLTTTVSLFLHGLHLPRLFLYLSYPFILVLHQSSSYFHFYLTVIRLFLSLHQYAESLLFNRRYLDPLAGFDFCSLFLSVLGFFPVRFPCGTVRFDLVFRTL